MFLTPQIIIIGIYPESSDNNNLWCQEHARVEADGLEFRKSREVWQLDAFVTSKSFCTCDYLRGSEF